MPVYTIHVPVNNNADLRATDRVYLRSRRLSVLGGAFRRVVACLASAVAGGGRSGVLMIVIDVAMVRLGVGGSAIFSSMRCSRCCWDLKRQASNAGRCRGATGVNSISSSPRTRRPPNDDFSIAGPPEQRGLSNDQPAVDRGAPPPTRDLPGRAFSQPPPLPRDEIIGLFPEPGASR